jgi:hypothetical protein
MSGTRAGLRVIEGGQWPRRNAVTRLHQFQGEHPQVGITSPHMGGQGRYIAIVPPETIPGESREITVGSLDLAGLMDQLDDLFGSPPGIS